MTVMIVLRLCVVCFLVANIRAAYESAGCSDQGCGIPCYMRPAADSCHYKPHSPCSNDGYDVDLENLIFNLDSSLQRLENKLVQKRVIPAGEICTPLEPISNGGVIYSDLLLSPGVIAHYVCQEGFILHGHDERECAPDGGWINSEKGIPVCRDSKVKCETLAPIPNGHILFDSVDTNTMQPGDMVTYMCDSPCVLEGDNYRICFSNGSWSGEEPTCILPELEQTSVEPTEKSSSEQVTTTEKMSTLAAVTQENVTKDSENYNTVLIAGVTAGGMGALLTVALVALAIFCICHRRKTRVESESARRYDPFQMTTKLIDDTDASALKTALLKEESSISVKIKPISKAGQTRNEEAKIETIHAEYSL